MTTRTVNKITTSLAWIILIGVMAGVLHIHALFASLVWNELTPLTGYKPMTALQGWNIIAAIQFLVIGPTVLFVRLALRPSSPIKVFNTAGLTVSLDSGIPNSKVVSIRSKKPR